MGNIAYQLTVCLFLVQLFLRALLEPQSHILVAAVQISDLSFFIRRKHVVQIAVTDFVHRHVKLIDRLQHPVIEPAQDEQCCRRQNHRDCQCHAHKEGPRHNGGDPGQNKNAVLCS